MTPAQLAAEFVAKSAGVEARVDTATGRVARLVAGAQRAAAPTGPTGDTKNTISAQPAAAPAGTVAWEAGTETWYAHFIEYGTSRMSPRPFIAPAADRYANEYAEQVAEATGF